MKDIPFVRYFRFGKKDRAFDPKVTFSNEAQAFTPPVPPEFPASDLEGETLKHVSEKRFESFVVGPRTELEEDFVRRVFEMREYAEGLRSEGVSTLERERLIRERLRTSPYFESNKLFEESFGLARYNELLQYAADEGGFSGGRRLFGEGGVFGDLLEKQRRDRMRRREDFLLSRIARALPPPVVSSFDVRERVLSSIRTGVIAEGDFDAALQKLPVPYGSSEDPRFSKERVLQVISDSSFSKLCFEFESVLFDIRFTNGEQLTESDGARILNTIAREYPTPLAFEALIVKQHGSVLQALQEESDAVNSRLRLLSLDRDAHRYVELHDLLQEDISLIERKRADVLRFWSSYEYRVMLESFTRLVYGEACVDYAVLIKSLKNEAFSYLDKQSSPTEDRSRIDLNLSVNSGGSPASLSSPRTVQLRDRSAVSAGELAPSADVFLPTYFSSESGAEPSLFSAFVFEGAKYESGPFFEFIWALYVLYVLQRLNETPPSMAEFLLSLRRDSTSIEACEKAIELLERTRQQFLFASKSSPSSSALERIRSSQLDSKARGLLRQWFLREQKLPALFVREGCIDFLRKLFSPEATSLYFADRARLKAQMARAEEVRFSEIFSPRSVVNRIEKDERLRSVFVQIRAKMSSTKESQIEFIELLRETYKTPDEFIVELRRVGMTGFSLQSEFTAFNQLLELFYGHEAFLSRKERLGEVSNSREVLPRDVFALRRDRLFTHPAFKVVGERIVKLMLPELRVPLIEGFERLYTLYPKETTFRMNYKIALRTRKAHLRRKIQSLSSRVEHDGVSEIKALSDELADLEAPAYDNPINELVDILYSKD